MSKIPQYPTSNQGSIVSLDNQLRVLRALSVFGHLRKEDIAQLIWPNSNPNSQRVMAHTTLQSMSEKKLITPRNNSLGTKSYILGSRGVQLLADQGLTDVPTGYDISSFTGPQFWHRTLATAFLIHQTLHWGNFVIPEIMLARDSSYLSRRMLESVGIKKVPDGLIIRQHLSHKLDNNELKFLSPDDTDPACYFDWVEVEGSFKDDDRLRAILHVLANYYEKFSMYQDLDYRSQYRPGKRAILDSSPDKNMDYAINTVFNLMRLGNLYFVFDSSSNHKNRIISVAKEYLKNKPSSVVEIIKDRFKLAEVQIKLPLSIQDVRTDSLGAYL